MKNDLPRPAGLLSEKKRALPKLRSVLFKLHLWLGLGLGLYFAMLGLTGSLLVFGNALDERVSPRLLTSEPHGQALPLSKIVAIVKHEYPDRVVKTITTPRHESGVWRVTFGDFGKPDTVHAYVHPYSGEFLGSRTRTAWFLGFMTYLHYRLWLGDLGWTLNGWGGLLTAVLLLSGIWLWWPRTVGHWKMQLSVKRGAGLRRALYDWHNVVGVYSLPLLLLIALTGAVFIFRAPVENVVYRLTNTPPQKPRKWKSEVAPLQQPLSSDILLQKASAALSDGRVTSITLPVKARDPFVARLELQQSGRGGGSGKVTLDQYSGRVLEVSDPRQAPLGVRLMNWNFPLHTGHWGGLITEILYIFLGLLPATLFVTGFWKWAHRRRGYARNRAHRRSQQEQFQPSASNQLQPVAAEALRADKTQVTS